MPRHKNLWVAPGTGKPRAHDITPFKPHYRL